MLSHAPKKWFGLDTKDKSKIKVIISPNNSVRSLDIGIVIALKEEFGEFFPHIAASPEYNDEINQYWYLFERADNKGHNYRCVVTFMEDMTPAKSAVIAERLMSQFRPSTIVNIGIAGSMDDEVLLGDVVVADQADDYLYEAKALSGRRRNFEFSLKGDPYKSSSAYVRHVTNLPYAYSNETQTWLTGCANDLQALLKPAISAKLVRKELLRNNPEIKTGCIASGPVLGASTEFVDWLKGRRDRKFVALEMESAGVLAAAYPRGTDTLIIRGISDFSDNRKKDLDKIGKGALRRYAMHNAIGLLWVLLDLGLLKASN